MTTQKPRRRSKTTPQAVEAEVVKPKSARGRKTKSAIATTPDAIPLKTGITTKGSSAKTVITTETVIDWEAIAYSTGEAIASLVIGWLGGKK